MGLGVFLLKEELSRASVDAPSPAKGWDRITACWTGVPPSPRRHIYLGVPSRAAVHSLQGAARAASTPLNSYPTNISAANKYCRIRREIFAELCATSALTGGGVALKTIATKLQLPIWYDHYNNDPPLISSSSPTLFYFRALRNCREQQGLLSWRPWVDAYIWIMGGLQSFNGNRSPNSPRH